jgi:hypothetical protein
MTSVQEDSSMEAPTPNMFFSSFGLTTSTTTTTYVLAIGLSYAKHTIKRGTTTLTSYLNANRIASQHPTKFSTMCKALKHGSNMITIMLSVCLASKDLKKSKKGWITSITFNYIFLCRRRISTSNGSEILSQVESSNNVTSISIVRVMDVVKAFDNNQWPLL